MEHAKFYESLVSLIQESGDWKLEEIQAHLDLLKKKERITAVEYEALLSLAKQTRDSVDGSVSSNTGE